MYIFQMLGNKKNVLKYKNQKQITKNHTAIFMEAEEMLYNLIRYC